MDTTHFGELLPELPKSPSALWRDRLLEAADDEPALLDAITELFALADEADAEQDGRYRAWALVAAALAAAHARVEQSHPLAARMLSGALATAEARRAQAAPDARRQGTVGERVLEHLTRLGPTRPGDLARALGVTSQQVSRALAQLKRADEVRQARGRPTADGRGVVWEATPSRDYLTALHSRAANPLLTALHYPAATTVALSLSTREVVAIVTEALRPFSGLDIAAIIRVAGTEVGIGDVEALTEIVASGVPEERVEI